MLRPSASEKLADTGAVKTATRAARVAVMGLGIVAAAAMLLHSGAIFSSNDVQDDAFIFARYAEHLAAGYGPVWNKGGPPVDGFTSPLYVALLASAVRCGADPVAAAQIVGVAGCVFLFLPVFLLSRSVLDRTDHFAVVLPGLLLASCSSLALWARSGMEVTLFMTFLTVAVLLHLRSLEGGEWTWGVAASGAFFISYLVRPEAALFWALAVVHGLLWYTTPGNDATEGASVAEMNRAALRWVAVSAAVFLVPFTAYTAWHYSVFSALLPNTYYAKSGGGIWAVRRGLAYVGRFLVTPMGVPLAMMPLAFLRLGELSRKRRQLRTYVVPLTLLYAAYIASVGGDCFAGYRFFLFIYPLALVVLVDLVSQLASIARRHGGALRAAAVWALVPFLGLTLAWPSLGRLIDGQVAISWSLRLLSAPDIRHRVQFEREAIGRYFRSMAVSGESIAVVPAGAIPYYSRLWTIDMLGLNDSWLAHQAIDRDFVRSSPRGWFPGHMKGDGAYVLAHRPTYILLSATITPEPGRVPEWYLAAYRPTAQIWKSDLFWRCYRRTTVPLEGGFLTYFKLKSECR